MMLNEARPEQITHYTKRGLWYGILSLIIIIGIIGILYQSDSYQHYIYTTIDNINWSLLILGWFTMGIAIAVLGYRWKALLPKHTHVSGRFLGLCLTGALLLNYAIPGPFGEFVAAWFLQKKSNIPLPLGIATAGVGRLIGLATAAFGTGLCWLFINPLPITEVQWIITGLVGSIGAGFILLVALFIIPKKLKPILSSRTGKISQVLLQLLEAISETTTLHRSSYIKAIGWSIIGHLLAVLGVWISLMSIGNPSSIVGILFSYFSSTCCGVVAFLFPGSQLAWDAIFTGLLVSSAGYNIADATSAVILLRAEQIALMLSGVFPLLWLIRRTAKESKNGNTDGEEPDIN